MELAHQAELNKPLPSKDKLALQDQVITHLPKSLAMIPRRSQLVRNALKEFKVELDLENTHLKELKV